MGKVKDGAESVKAGKPAKGGSGESRKGSAIGAFFANLASASVYKPLQGRQARIWTGVGLAVVILLGLYQLYQTIADGSTPTTRFGVPVAVGAVLGWLTFRLLQFPPFVEFLIATEAEMNKVSWTSQEDLKRATIVVLVTVAFMAIFLFGVDVIWSNVLQFIGVIRIGDTSGMTTNA